MSRSLHLLQVVATAVFAALLTEALHVWAPVSSLPCVTVEIASSQEKAAMLKSMADSYNHHRFTVDGRCVRVNVDQVDSGIAEAALANDWHGSNLPPRPDVWSPASSAWVVLLQATPAGGRLVPTGPLAYDSLFQSPLVIGMPKKMADALGYPKRSLGWSDVFALSADPRGWASVGHPEWGKFRLGKTNPTVSTSGLQALIGTYHAAHAKPGTLPGRTFAERIERSVVHYGQTVKDFLRNLRDADDRRDALKYVSAIALEEEELVAYDDPIVGGDRNATPPRVPLVAIYPKDGTPVATHPYVILKWSAHADQARDFERFVGEPHQQSIIDAHGFREANGTVAQPLRSEKFIDPAQPEEVLPVPEAPELKLMLDDWKQIRRPARVLALFDSAVKGAELKRETDNLCSALSSFGPHDRLGVWQFPTSSALSADQIAALQPIDATTCDALKSLRTLRGHGDLDQAIAAAVAAMSSSFDPSAINAVLVIDPAAPNPSSADDDLERQLRNQPQDGFVRIFTVGPSDSVLPALALAGEGSFYDAVTPQDFVTHVASDF